MAEPSVGSSATGKFKKILGPLVFAVLALVALRGCVGCMNYVETATTAAPAPPGEALRRLPGVKSVEVNDVNVFVTARYEHPLPAMYLLDASRLLRRIAEQMQARPGDLPTQTNVVLLIEVPLSDRLGGEEYSKILDLNFTAVDLRAAHLDNLSDARLLDLAHDADPVGRAGVSVAEAWCEDFSESAPNLCVKLVG